MITTIHTIKRHEENKGDELTELGHKLAYASGAQFARGTFLSLQQEFGEVKDILVFHSPLNRANQTATEFAKAIKDKTGEKYNIEAPKAEELLKVQGFDDDYRKSLIEQGLVSQDGWMNKGLVYLLQHDPAATGNGESNASVAGRIAKHIDNLRYLTKGGKATVSVTHGPLPDHFLAHVLFDNYKAEPIEKVMEKVGGPFNNGDSLEVIAMIRDHGLDYEVRRAGRMLTTISSSHMHYLAENLK
jgi:broad specificity phosphatase PhoE